MEKCNVPFRPRPLRGAGCGHLGTAADVGAEHVSIPLASYAFLALVCIETSPQRQLEVIVTGMRNLLIAGLLLISSLAGPVFAQEIKIGDLVIDQPWSRATPGGAKMGAGYLTIENTGVNADRLVGASSAIAERVEIHEMVMKDDVMSMRQIPGLPIEPGTTVMLRPGGYHLMFVGLKAPLKQGMKFTATLEFEKAGKVDVTFDVEAIGAQTPGHTGPER